MNRFYKSRNFRKIIGFWCGHGCIERHKTDRIVLILMKFKTLVVKILLKHSINKVLYFLVKKGGFILNELLFTEIEDGNLRNIL